MLLYHLHGVMLLVGLLVGRSSLVVAGEGDLKHLKFMGAGRLLEGSEEDCKNIHKSTFKLFKTHESWTEHELLKNHRKGEMFAFDGSGVGVAWKNSVLVKDISGIRAVINDRLSDNAKTIIQSSRPLIFTLTGVCIEKAVPEVLHALVGCDICLVTNTPEDRDDDIRNIIINRFVVENHFAFRLYFEAEFDSVLFEEKGRVVGIGQYSWRTTLVTLRESDDDEWGQILTKYTITEQLDVFRETSFRLSGVTGVYLFIMNGHYPEAYVLWFNDVASGSRYEVLLPSSRDSTVDDRKVMGNVMSHIRINERNDRGDKDGILRVRISGESQMLQHALAALMLTDTGLLIVGYPDIITLSKDTTWKQDIDALVKSETSRITWERIPPPMRSVLLTTTTNHRWGVLLATLPDGYANDWLTATESMHEIFPNQDVDYIFVGERSLRVIIVYIPYGTEYGRYEVWLGFYGDDVDLYLPLMSAVMTTIRQHNVLKQQFRQDNLRQQQLLIAVADPPKRFANALCKLVINDTGNLLIDGIAMDAIREDDQRTQVLQQELLDKASKAVREKFGPRAVSNSF
eukprot:GHVS01086277.1.p1 GENE.GHVS01086277.1~~GHVS01086277.1.p1  ORF type:complete len:571 (-),score=37.70 GHVS01086277.1:445-2157(-)